MKKILFFAPSFYGYNERIIEEFNKNGYEVKWYPEKLPLDIKGRILNKVFPSLSGKNFDRYIENILIKNKEEEVKKIIIIFGAHFMKKKHLEMMKKFFPFSEIVYYAWDSVENFPVIKELLEGCDRSLTFDSSDAQKYNSQLLPLFYSFKEESGNAEYDVSTVMSFFADKIDSFNSILEELPEKLNTNFYLRIRNRIYYYRLKFLYGRKLKKMEKYFQFDSLSAQQTKEMLSKAKAVVDCPLPNQIGLTMRTFETLALNRKLITTNKDIVNYDFYTDDNIYIIGTGRKDILKFINSPFNKEYEISDKYSLQNFVKNLLGE